jgi:PKD repeat protein
VNGLTVTINGAATSGYSGASITRIHWEWGDGSSEDHWFPATHTYSNYGTYVITVTAYQSDGLTSTKIVQLVLSRSVASSALAFLGQIKIKASIIKNQTEGSYSFTLQNTPINLPFSGLASAPCGDTLLYMCIQRMGIRCLNIV